MDLLARDMAPLSAEEWADLDHTVVETARKYLVGRRVVPLFGPLGDGLPVVPTAELTGLKPGASVTTGETQLLPLTTLSHDFTLKYADLAMAQRLELPLDRAPAAAAAYTVAVSEDELVLRGLAAGAGTKVKAGDWATAGGLFGDVVKAAEALGKAGFPGPYAVVLPPGAWAASFRPVAGGALTEKGLIEDLAAAGLYASPALSAKQALVLEPGAVNVDLAVGVDLKIAYLGNQALDHSFRVFETVALRVHRPQAIAIVG